MIRGKSNGGILQAVDVKITLTADVALIVQYSISGLVARAQSRWRELISPWTTSIQRAQILV